MRYEVFETYTVMGHRLKKLYAVYKIEKGSASRITPYSTKSTANKKLKNYAGKTLDTNDKVCYTTKVK